MADAIRGNGLFIAHNSLAALVEDPQLLDNMRRRFSESPPSYRSRESGTTTRSQSSNAPSSEAPSRGTREIELHIEHSASFPSAQFPVQIREECRQLYKERYLHEVPHRFWEPSPALEASATEIVKKRWIEQGIWKDDWNNGNKPRGRWKHEEPLQSEPGSETDSGGEGQANPFASNPFAPKRKEPPAKRQKAKLDARQIAERRAVLEREREASRPYHQFLWQVSRERERIQEEQGLSGSSIGEHADINTTAYETIRSKWTKQGMWHMKWDILPGMWWKHEQSLQAFLASDPIFNPPNQREDRGHEAREEPARVYSGNMFRGFSPWAQARAEDLSPVDPGPQRPAQNTPEPSPSPQPPLPNSGAILDDRPEEDAPIDLVNAPIVAKARRGRPRRQPVLQNGSGEPSSSAPAAPRRSKRLQEAKLNSAQDTTAPRQRRAVAGNPTTASSAKPQGISKARRLAATKRGTRKGS
ncbi:hypothetical protein F4823DRAFT_639970 [Ustulina deusta]|nr:hypothetical protein F4823DRAFT_639970 [Ustulina deusta]